MGFALFQVRRLACVIKDYAVWERRDGEVHLYLAFFYLSLSS